MITNKFYTVKKLYNKTLGNNKGFSVVLVASSMVILLVFAAAVADMGGAYVLKSKMSAGVDAASLAGAQELKVGRDAALDKAREYALKNDLNPLSLDVQVSEDVKSVTVNNEKTIDMFFAKILGRNNLNVKVKSKAIAAPITGMRGVRPLGVAQQAFVFGTTVVLKEGAGGGTTGNYGALALGGTGASNFRSNIENGYPSMMRVGEYIPTETGNMSSPTRQGINTLLSACTHIPQCTYDSYEPDCPKVIIIPVLETLAVNGRSEVKIVGFASFFLEDVRDGEGGHSEISGKFIKYSANGEISESQTNFGLVGIKLVQ